MAKRRPPEALLEVHRLAIESQRYAERRLNNRAIFYLAGSIEQLTRYIIEREENGNR